MKRILMIAPACFPVTGAENIVNIKLLQALSTSDGFNIDVISRQREWENYPTDELSYFGVRVNHLDIIRVDNKRSPETIYQHLMTYLKTGIVYKGCHWAYPAILAACKLIKKNHYDYVLTKNTPSFIVGYYIKKKFGLKWVATWNDPFPSEMYPAPYGHGIDAKIGRSGSKAIRMMEEADVHIFPNDRLRDYMMKYLKINDKRTIVIPHAAITNNMRYKYQKGKTLRFVHSGNLGSPRDPYTFLAALREFLNNHSDADVTFTIMGKNNENLSFYIDKLELPNYVRFVNSKKYSESLSDLNSYDVAVIIEAACEEGIFLPTKVSDFMQMHIPIFAVSPAKGVLNDLYNNGDIPYFANVREANNILSQLETIYKDFCEGRLTHNQIIKKEYLSDSVVEQYLDL